tara:strand:+ start:1120 stop:1770 length:651 start_codon:yes stop_codon:yes gene_type:complete
METPFIPIQDSVPSDPPPGQSVLWQSRGVYEGEDGDIMVKITDINGDTVTKKLVDYDSGSGSGFADYNNAGSPISIAANTWLTVTNDGQGAFSNSTYIPNGITRLMDTSTGQFDFSELSLGDAVLIRNDFSVNPDTNNALLNLRYQLGSGANAYTLETVIGRLDDGSGKDYRFSLVPQLIYMGDLNTKDNPVTLQIKLSTTGTVNNAGSVIQVIRR